jgi:SAM-dependent methyltransferase
VFCGPLKATLIDTDASAYDTFAPYYDAFTSGSDYEAWTTQLLALAARRGWRGSSLLDMACGTGKSFVPFLERGFDVTACDSSRAMLNEAARKAPEARLLHADVRDLTMVGRFDLVTCLDDSLNYLLDAGDLSSALCSMAANLAPAGLAIFDLNTLRAYRTTFARNSVTVCEDTVFVWRGECGGAAQPGCRAAARIDVFAPRRDGLYNRIGTRHEQRHFPREQVVELLGRARLECLDVYGVLDDGELVETADEAAQLKVLYIARHAKGGAAQ